MTRKKKPEEQNNCLTGLQSLHVLNIRCKKEKKSDNEVSSKKIKPPILLTGGNQNLFCVFAQKEALADPLQEELLVVVTFQFRDLLEV